MKNGNYLINFNKNINKLIMNLGNSGVIQQIEIKCPIYQDKLQMLSLNVHLISTDFSN